MSGSNAPFVPCMECGVEQTQVLLLCLLVWCRARGISVSAGQIKRSSDLEWSGLLTRFMTYRLLKERGLGSQDETQQAGRQLESVPICATEATRKRQLQCVCCSRWRPR
jgi:hypothetical protein